LKRPPSFKENHSVNPRPSAKPEGTAAATGLARALSKLGFCSRSKAWELIQSGGVRVNGQVQRDPERRVHVERDRIEVEGRSVERSKPAYLVLNKPRGQVTTLSDEKGRATVMENLGPQGLPFVAPVGRLDRASEGLLLLTNDTSWAAHITSPTSRLEKVYHVQIDGLADEQLLLRLREGIEADGEFLRVGRVRVLRTGTRNCWLEIGLHEGKNRHIRRLLKAAGHEVLRLIRIAIGPLQLGELAKGKFRFLTPEEVRALGPVAR